VTHQANNERTQDGDPSRCRSVGSFLTNLLARLTVSEPVERRQTRVPKP